jgi:hypothetical protein
LIVLGAWFFSQRSTRALALSGVALSLACVLRYQNGLVVLVLLAALPLERRWREMFAFLSAGAGVAVGGGLLDWVTWGSPFHSLVAYVDFNVLRSGAASFGVEPFTYYMVTLWSSAGPWVVVLAACFCVGTFRQPVLAGVVLCYVLAHSVLPHKEFRFLVPCLPLFAIVSAVGVESILKRLPAPHWIGVASALGVTTAFAWQLRHLTYEEMGQYSGTERASLSVWRSEQEPTLLLADAGQRRDICGLEVVGSRAAFTGGYTYLHRDVPLIYASEICDSAPANYLIGPIGRVLPSAYRLEHQRGSWGLFRRDGECRYERAEEDRWLEGARDMGIRLRKARQVSDGGIHFDLQRDAGSFARGWGHGETIACKVARWAVGKQAVVNFDFEPGERTYQLNLKAQPHDMTTRQRFTVHVNGVPVHLGVMPPRPESFSVDIPDGALRSGQNQIEIAFARAERASQNDNRVLSALFHALEIVPKKDAFSIDLALSDSQRNLRRGFFGTEKEGDVTFAWSDGPSSEVEGSLALARTAYTLIVNAESVPFVADQNVRVYVNDTPAGSMSIPARWDKRQLIIPRTLLTRGNNRVRFEYAATVRPAAVHRKLSDQRELAVRFRSIELRPLIVPRDLDVGSSGARPFLLHGWSADEGEGMLSAAWTNAREATVLVSFDGIERAVLRLHAEGYGPALPINVAVSLNGEHVGAFVAPRGWQTVSVPLPAQVGGGAGELLSFAFDRMARPSDQDSSSTDRRTLALRVDRLWVEPEQQEQSVTAALRTLR